MKGRCRVRIRKSFTSGHTSLNLICLNVLMVLCVSGCREQVDLVPVSAKPPVAVNALTLSKVNETVRTATYYGTLVPNRTITVEFTAPGKISSIVPPGKSVSTGDLLAELNVDVLEKQKQSLQSQIAQAQAENEIQQLQQRVAGIDEEIQARRIVAPFDCIVDETFVYENSLVQPRLPILRVIDSTNPKIEIDLPSRVARFVDAELEIYFVLDDQGVAGRLAEKSRKEVAGSVSCKFDIDEDLSGVNYRFGQTVEVRFNFRTNKSGYWVPISSLDRSGEGIWSLLVVETEGESSFVATRTVSIVQVNDDQALVDGDRLDGVLAISNGIHRVALGQKVKPRLVQNEGSSDEEESSE